MVVDHLSEIKLIRTDTTLDLSQKAEKVCFRLRPFGYLNRKLNGGAYTGNAHEGLQNKTAQRFKKQCFVCLFVCFSLGSPAVMVGAVISTKMKTGRQSQRVNLQVFSKLVESALSAPARHLSTVRSAHTAYGSSHWPRNPLFS